MRKNGTIRMGSTLTGFPGESTNVNPSFPGKLGLTVFLRFFYIFLTLIPGKIRPLGMKKLTCLLGALFLTPHIQAQGLIVTDEPVLTVPRAPVFPRPPRPIDRYLPIETRKSNVKTQIRGQVATTTITQTLHNPANRRVQGSFLFPVPENARIDSFAMDIDGELTEGELLDAEKARKIYEDIVRRTLDPALFEFCDQQLFRIRIFPFQPRQTRQIRIRYTHLLTRDGELASYVLPLRQRAHCQNSPDASLQVKISMIAGDGQKFRSLYSPSHDIDTRFGDGKKKATVKLSGSPAKTTSDFQLYFSSEPLDAKAEPVTTEFLTFFEEADSRSGHYLLLLSPRVWKAGEPNEYQPKDVIFLLDSSASMRDGKLDKAREGLQACIDFLNPDDRFQVIRFSTESEALFNRPVKAREKNVRRAKEFIDGIRAIGGTAIEEALSLAMENLAATSAPDHRPRQIVFITDGRPTLGETDEKVLVRNLENRLGEAGENARVFSFGIGSDINTHLLDLLARETRAHADFALPDEDIETKISRFYLKFAEPVLSNLSLELTGAARTHAQTPRILPDLFRGDQLVVLGRFNAKSGTGESGTGGQLKLTGEFRGETITIESPVTFAKSGRQNRFIPRLWAVHRVGWLLEQVRLNGESRELVEEITSLARKYAIVTPYTSWLILEDEAKRDVPMTYRSLPTLERASAAREELNRRAVAFSSAKSGGDALASAASESDLKQAKNIAAQARAITRSNYAEAGKSTRVAEPVSRLINGKSFYLNSGQWIDSTTQSLGPGTPVRRIKFGTDSYFEFIRKHPSANQWLSTGPQLRLNLDNNEIIEIY